MAENENETIKVEELTPPDSVSYFIYRADIAREQRHTFWWRVAALIMAALLVATNWYWIWKDHQYVDEEITMTQEATTDGGGDAVISGAAKGDVHYYGYGQTDDHDSDTDAENGR